MHHYSSEHIYDEVTTLAKPKGKEPSSTVAMVEQDSAAGYETIATDIPTKSNEAYGYLNRQQL